MAVHSNCLAFSFEFCSDITIISVVFVLYKLYSFLLFFVQGDLDNPKVNAIYLMKGSAEGMFQNQIYLTKGLTEKAQ